jgi:hypothetical protein
MVRRDRSVEDAAQIRVFVAHALMRAASRLISTPALRPAAQRVFMTSGGPQGHGDSLTVAALQVAANTRARS